MQAGISVVLSYVDVHLWAILMMVSVIPESQSGRDLYRKGVIGEISHYEKYSVFVHGM